MNIIYYKQAAKVLERMDSATKHRIRQGIKGIPSGDIKLLHGYSDGLQRLRIGKYRIVFNYVIINDENTLYIMDIDTRGDIYK